MGKHTDREKRTKGHKKTHYRRPRSKVHKVRTKRRRSGQEKRKTQDGLENKYNLTLVE